MNEDQVQSFHSGRVSGCVTLQAPNPASSTCSRNRPVRMARTTSPICTIRVFVIVSLQLRAGWQARRDSNPQHAVLETAALPLELLAFDHIPPSFDSGPAAGKAVGSVLLVYFV